jgi:hypothetical protein
MTKIDDTSALGDYAKEKGFRDCWMVCNESIDDHDGAPPVKLFKNIVIKTQRGHLPSIDHRSMVKQKNYGQTFKSMIKRVKRRTADKKFFSL